jgi:hypothetical protein
MPHPLCNSGSRWVPKENCLMDIQELRIALAKFGIRPDAVSINGNEATEEQYRLENKGKLWVVYYFERGNMIGLREFYSEEDACEHLLKLLEKDLTTRVAQ